MSLLLTFQATKCLEREKLEYSWTALMTRTLCKYENLILGEENYIVNCPGMIDYLCKKAKLNVGLYIIPCTKMNCSRLKTKG